MERNSIIDAQEEFAAQKQTLEDAELQMVPHPEAPPLPTDPEWEMYKEMCAQREEADGYNDDPDLQFAKRETPKHCPIPKDDIIPPPKGL